MSISSSSLSWVNVTTYHFSYLSKTPTFRISQIVKRLLDIILASVGLILLSPFFIILALIIYCTSPGPILYRSARVGRNLQIFHMYKFRTMQINADKLWAEMRNKIQHEQGLFKLRKDPRVTPIGGFLRATSIDEFPQLINVIKGDMSLVGPRPFLAEESKLFKPPYTIRFQVTPGMTGSWQVSGRSNISFEEMCKLEMDYILHWSLLKDIIILIKTIPAVLQKQGAY